MEIILYKGTVPYAFQNPSRSRLRELLSQGFRYPEKVVKAVQTLTPDLDPILINTATQSLLKKQLGLSAMKIKLITDNRPYQDLEALIALGIEGANWEEKEPRISFETES